MHMAALDVDDILRAQGSDSESDQDAQTEAAVLDTEAFDRRLEEILNADDEDDDVDDNFAGSSSPFSGFVTRRSEVASDSPGGTFSQLHSSHDDGADFIGAQYVSRLPSVTGDENAAYNEEFKALESHVDSSSVNRQTGSLSSNKSYSDDESDVHLQPKIDSTVVPRLESSNKDIEVFADYFSTELSGPQRGTNVFSDTLHPRSSHIFHADETSPKLRPLINTQDSGSPSSLDTISTPSFAAVANRKTTTITAGNDALASASMDIPLSVRQRIDADNVGEEAAQETILLSKANPNNFDQVLETEFKGLTRNESAHESMHADRLEDMSPVLDDDTGSIVFDAESFSSSNSINIVSDDGSEQEEIKSVLSKGIIASEVDATSPTHSSALENVPSVGIAVPQENFRELPCSALDRAEEVEKKAALTGFGIEEGAASQPLRLQGLLIGPPNIGYVRLDALNSVSQILSLTTTTREHGIAQAIAMQGHHLAVGLSKGSTLLLSLKSNDGKFQDAADKPLFLPSPDKAHAAVTSLSFNVQGELLLVGHANGFLALWEISSKGVSSRPINVEHTAALLHTSFLYTKSQKAISADCKGLVLLHSISSSAFGGYSVTSQCLVDGQNTGRVLCVSPISLDIGMESSGYSSSVHSSTPAATPTALTSIVGGMMRGVVAGKSSDHAKKHVPDGGIIDEAGNMVVFVTLQSIFVFRMPPMLEKCAVLARPEGIRDGAIPYIAWRRLRIKPGGAARGNLYSRRQISPAEPSADPKQQSDEEGENNSYPLLVLGWDKKVFILRLLKADLQILGSWDLDVVICGVTWLDEQIVAILTLKEQICLFTKEGLEVQCVAIESDGERKSLELAYHTHMLNIFGNPEKTYFSSMTSWAGTMLLLGPQQIYRAQLLPWQDQLRALRDAGDWMGAFHVGMELFNGRALAVMGLPRGTDALQKIVTPTLLNLLSNYIDEVFAYLSLAFGSTMDSTMENKELARQVKEQYARVGGVAIEFCVHIHQTDVLFSHIFHKFCAAGQRGTFLELLEPYILKDTLGALAPEVMQGLVKYYNEMGWLQRVELCVLHMDIASLDFNQVVKLCRENRLYSALIYLFNKGLDDYKSPLEELLMVVQDISNPYVQACGYKLLVYLKYCLLGLAFPPGRGEIPVDRLPELRRELLQCLLDIKPLNKDEKLLMFQSIIHPRLSCLLAFDLKATLEVLWHAFPEYGPLGIGKEYLDKNVQANESGLNDKMRKGRQLLQEIVDAFTDILERIHLHTVNADSKSPVEMDAWHLCMGKIDVGCIMEFIADFVALGQAKISRVVLSRIMDYLVSTDKQTKADEARRKESILVKILNGVPGSEWNFARILELALQAHYWQASACLLAKKGDIVAALDSYMKDKEQPYNGFLFILDVLSPEKQLNRQDIVEFRSSVLARLPELLQLSSEATLVILLKHFSKEHKAILLDLAPYPPLLFQYLRQIMNARLGYKSTLQTSRSISSLSDRGIESCEQNMKSAEFSLGNEKLSDLLKNPGLEFSDDMEELYVELLCQFEPTSVLAFLKSFEDYRLEHCLKLCQKYGIDDAAAYLLERVGDVSSALSLVLANMDYLIRDMDLCIARLFAQQGKANSEVTDNVEQVLSVPEIATACTVMRSAVELCQRNTWRMNTVESEALWFRLLDRFVDPLRRLHEVRKLLKRTSRAEDLITNKTGEGIQRWKVARVSRRAVNLMQRVLVYMIGEIIDGMMGYIPLSIIMENLLSNNGKHEFGDFRGTILQMLGLYGYEQTILLTAKNVVEEDMFHKLSIYKRRATRGYAPCSSTCCICKERLQGSEATHGQKGASNSRRRRKPAYISVRDMPSSSRKEMVMIFPCGHAAHSSCAVPEIDVVKSKPEFINCPYCHPKLGAKDLPKERRTHSNLF